MHALYRTIVFVKQSSPHPPPAEISSTRSTSSGQFSIVTPTDLGPHKPHRPLVTFLRTFSDLGSVCTLRVGCGPPRSTPNRTHSSFESSDTHPIKYATETTAERTSSTHRGLPDETRALRESCCARSAPFGGSQRSASIRTFVYRKASNRGLVISIGLAGE